MLLVLVRPGSGKRECRRARFAQYNPIFHPELAEFGPKVPVDYERDKLFGLATYYMAHGDFTYFGFGRHPYRRVQELWFEAIKHDVGQPEGPYSVLEKLVTVTETPVTVTSFLTVTSFSDGDFERADAAGNPEGWMAAEPVELDAKVKHGGGHSARIASSDVTINNINRHPLRLKPNTTYTLSAWCKTESVRGSPGAQVYAYDFAGSSGTEMLTWTGSGDWREQRTAFTTGADGEGRITFRMYGATGTAWFDDIQVLEGAHVPQQVFARRYTKGLVLVKPFTGVGYDDSTATTHTLPGRFRPLRADGTLGEPIGEVTLRSGEAAILASLTTPP